MKFFHVFIKIFNYLNYTTKINYKKMKHQYKIEQLSKLKVIKAITQ